MMSEQEITEKLAQIGVKESEMPRVMQDVAEVIFGKVTAAFLEALPEKERLHVRSLQPSQYEAYLKENAASLPLITQEQFDAIHDETWRDYFASVS